MPFIYVPAFYKVLRGVDLSLGFLAPYTLIYFQIHLFLSFIYIHNYCKNKNKIKN